MDGLFDEHVSAVPSGGQADPENDGEAAAPVDTAGSASVAQMIGVVEAGLARIESALESRHALDRFREAQVDRLHAELQDHRNDLVGKAVHPVFQSMIRLHDDFGKVLDALGKEEPGALTVDRVVGLLRGFRDDVELALDQHGVTTFRSLTEEFDPRRQTVVRKIETEKPDAVGRVADSVNPGFESADAVLKKERVAVFVAARYSAPEG
jgi:molecular chaperone GrpE